MGNVWRRLFCSKNKFSPHTSANSWSRFSTLSKVLLNFFIWWKLPLEEIYIPLSFNLRIRKGWTLASLRRLARQLFNFLWLALFWDCSICTPKVLFIGISNLRTSSYSKMDTLAWPILGSQKNWNLRKKPMKLEGQFCMFRPKWWRTEDMTMEMIYGGSVFYYMNCCFVDPLFLHRLWNLEILRNMWQILPPGPNPKNALKRALT